MWGTSGQTGRTSGSGVAVYRTGGTQMAHIHLPEGLPGIRGPLVFSPDTLSRCAIWWKSYSALRTVSPWRNAR